MKEHLELLANLSRLPEMRQELAELKRRLAELEGKSLMLIVVGGHSRNIGKTSRGRRTDLHAAAMGMDRAKITQYGHGVCSSRATRAIAAAKPEQRSIPSC